MKLVLMRHFCRYSITTILNLLKEVAHHASSPKMDWDALVKDTCTGISSAREYQMLWRHIAYQTPLLEKLESGSEPLVGLFALIRSCEVRYLQILDVLEICYILTSRVTFFMICMPFNDIVYVFKNFCGLPASMQV